MTFSRRSIHSQRASSRPPYLVQRRDRLEVEAVQTLNSGEFGSLDPALDHAPFAVNHLQFDQAGKELDMI